LTIRIAPERVPHREGYLLAIAPGGLTLHAHDAAGAFYGACTLAQIIQSAEGPLPCLTIDDWPDFAARGVMLDISRDKVPTMETLLALVDRLAGWKINQLQLYTEHTFAYRAHPEVWAQASPFTGEEILALDSYCRERFIELAPNQNSFGHLHRWLKHPRYTHLAEAPDGAQTPWGFRHTGPYSLCPTDPASLDFLRGLYDELLPHFTSRLFNVGCDETFDVGQGRSKAECEARGAGRVYLDFLKKIHAEVTARGHTMQFWGDIIIEHPELIPELPQDAVALEWGYEAGHPFDAHSAQFRAAGLQFYVCPGTSAWNSLAGRTANALGNLRNAAENGLKHEASGYLITDWGDNGHWQTLPVSFLGLAMGAAYAWAWEANRDVGVASVVSRFAFDDVTGNAGGAAYDLGNVYQAMGLDLHNSSPLFWMLQKPLTEIRGYHETVSAARLAETLDAIDQACAPLASARIQRPDAELIQREFDLTARMLRHAAHRAQFAFGACSHSNLDLSRDLHTIIGDYRDIWLSRNRIGGLSDSAERLEKALAEYI
jgi:hypothetical protein